MSWPFFGLFKPPEYESSLSNINVHVYRNMKSELFSPQPKKKKIMVSWTFDFFSPKSSILNILYFKVDKKKKFPFSLGGSAKKIEVHIPDPKRAEVKMSHY